MYPILSPFKPASNLSYHTVSAVIRLGHKYQMTDLVKDAVDYLKRWYTSVFDEWAAGRLYAPDAPFEHVHAIGVVNLARLVDEPLLLPSALLMCCSLDEDIVKGFAREDGTRETLSPHDLGLCFAARKVFAGNMLVILLSVFDSSVSNGCADPSRCRDALQRMILDGLRIPGAIPKIVHPDILRSFVHFLGPCAVCASCQEMVRERDVDVRKRAWQSLPKIFKLEFGEGEWPGKLPI